MKSSEIAQDRKDNKETKKTKSEIAYTIAAYLLHPFIKDFNKLMNNKIR